LVAGILGMVDPPTALSSPAGPVMPPSPSLVDFLPDILPIGQTSPVGNHVDNGGDLIFPGLGRIFSRAWENLIHQGIMSG